MGRSHATLVGQSFSVINIIWFLEMALMLITLEINTISGFCYWDSFMSELTKGEERYLSNQYGFELLLAWTNSLYDKCDERLSQTRFANMRFGSRE